MGNLCSSYITDTQTSFKNHRSYSSTLKNHSASLQDFHYLGTLGTGRLTKIILVRQKSDQELYAIKMIQTEGLEDIIKQEYSKFDRQVLIEFENPFILRLYNIFIHQTHLCIVLDFMQGGSLGFHLSKQGRLKPSSVSFIAAEVLTALEILHRREFIYKDLKPENVLFDSEGHVKLADFSLNTANEVLTSRSSKPEYTAPETITSDLCGLESDFWAFGVLIFHMIQGVTPFEGPTAFETCNNIVQGKYSFPSGFDKIAMDLVSKLLVTSPNDRLTSHKAIKDHKFFFGTNWEQASKRELQSPLNINVKDPVDLKYFPKQSFPAVALEFDQSVEINASMASQHHSQIHDISYSPHIS